MQYTLEAQEINGDKDVYYPSHKKEILAKLPTTVELTLKSVAAKIYNSVLLNIDPTLIPYYVENKTDSTKIDPSLDRYSA